MGIFSGIGSALRAVADTFDQNKPRDMSDPRYWADFGGLSSFAGVTVTERRVSQLGAVQAVRYGLSSAMSSLPISVFRRGKDGARKALPDHPLTRLLAAKPNDRNTPAEFIGEIAWHLSYWRNAYCRIRAGSDPTADNFAIGSLEIIHPRRFARMELLADGHYYYTFNPPASIVQGASLRAETYRDDEIWHLRGNPLTEDGLLGEPIWKSAREVFGRAVAVHEYGDIWFANSGQTGGIIKHPGNFKDKEDKRTFLDNWRDAATGRNRHRDRLLTHGADYLALKVTNAEAQLLETEKQSDVEVFGLWSFPPHRAGRLDRATFSNIEQQSLDFVVYGLAPLAIAIEQGAERDLLLNNEDGALFVECNFAGLLRGDLKNRYAAYLIGRQGEWLSANDIRRFENMTPRTDEGGDDYKNPLTKDSGAGADDDADPEDTGAPSKDGNDGK
jgi:HK97 family phage portal protein